jgi:hypothetical protein
MKSKLLLCLALCASLLGCKEELVNPGEPQVTMSSSSQTLVEGGEAIEVTIELDREFNKPHYLYLDYGDAYGEYANFFDTSFRDQSIRVIADNQERSVLAVTFLAGERKKTIRLKAEENGWYRGDRPIELKVLSLTGPIDRKPVYHASLEIGYRDNEPKPVFGIFRSWSADTERAVKAYPGEFKLTFIASIPFQFPQKVYLNYAGTAQEGVHFERVEYVLFKGNTVDALPISQPTVLRVLSGGNFNPEKNIRIELSSAEDGEIAKEDILYNSIGEYYTFGNYYNLILTEK